MSKDQTPKDRSKRSGPTRSPSSGSPIRMALYLVLLVVVSVAIATGFGLMNTSEQPRLASPLPHLDLPLTAAEMAEMNSILSKVSYDGVWKNSANMGPTGVDVGKITPFRAMTAEHVINLPILAGVSDAAGRDWYVIAMDGLIRFEPKDNSTTSIPVPNGLPETKFCSGITRDTKRERIMVLTEEFAETSNLVNNTILLAYDPTKNEWSLIAKIKDLTVQGLAYSPSDDTFYALAFKSTEEGGFHSGSILQLTADGAIKNMVPIYGDAGNRLASQPPSAQLAVADRFLIVTLERKCIVLDRTTGRILRQIQ